MTGVFAFLVAGYLHYVQFGEEREFPPRSQWKALAEGPLCIHKRKEGHNIWHPVNGKCDIKDEPPWTNQGQVQIDAIYPEEEISNDRQFIEVTPTI